MNDIKEKSAPEMAVSETENRKILSDYSITESNKKINSD